MNQTQNKKLTKNSKVLRKNMTREEKHLWYDFLKQLPYTVHRQKVIGSYIVDFYIASSKIAIELDGSQHYEEKMIVKDIKRDFYLNSLGIRVLRYSNYDVNKNFEEVCKDIYEKAERFRLDKRDEIFTPHPTKPMVLPPSPQGEGLG